MFEDMLLACAPGRESKAMGWAEEEGTMQYCLSKAKSSVVPQGAGHGGTSSELSQVRAKEPGLWTLAPASR